MTALACGVRPPLQVDIFTVLHQVDGRAKALEIVRRRNYTEAQSWQVIDPRCDGRFSGARSEIADAFALYANILLAIIEADISELDYRAKVIIPEQFLYSTLLSILAPQHTSRDRSTLRAAVEELHRFFVAHCSQEEIAYLTVRRLCKG